MGNRLLFFFSAVCKRFRSHIPIQKKPFRLYWEWWPKPVFTPGGRNWITELSEMVGAIQCIWGCRPRKSPDRLEEVAARQPDYTWLCGRNRIPADPEGNVLSRAPWQGLPFAQEERIHILEEGWFCRPSPRLLTGLACLGSLLYPDQIFPTES